MGRKVTFVKPSLLMPPSVWKPNPGSQSVAFDLEANEILYWGDRGPGKTSWQIARALSRFFLGYGHKYKVLMVGLRIKSLSGCVTEVEKILTRLENVKDAKCVRQKRSGDWKWTAPEGEEFRIINLKSLEQIEDMIGQEYNVQLWNELCHYPSPKLYILLSGSNRSAFDPITDTPRDFNGYLTPDGKPLPPCPEEILAASNTRGVGKLWVRKKFIEIAAPLPQYELRTGMTEHKVRDVTEKFVTASLQGVQNENPKLSTRYIATLREQTKHDPVLRREWCEGGDWYTPSGGAFDHIWRPDKHILLGKLKFDSNWLHNLSVNYSSSRPTCVLWSAETDIMCKMGDLTFLPGSVIFYHELYLCDEGDPHLGDKMSIRSLARKILDESNKLVEQGVVSEVTQDGFGSRNLFIPIADGELSERLADNGVYLDKVDALVSDRREVKEAGLALVRERLSASAEDEEDGIFFAEACTHCIRTLPDLPVDVDDPTIVDDEGEDYCYESVRLRAMSMSAPVEEFNIVYA